MTNMGLSTWLATCLHITSPRQEAISAALKQAHAETLEAVKRNIAESEKTIAAPIGNAQVGMEKLFCMMTKARRQRRDEIAH